MPPTIELESVERLSKDLRDSAKLLTDAQARYLIDTYYQLQEVRKATSNQAGANNRRGEPSEITKWAADQFEKLEKQISEGALKRYAMAHPAGRWVLSINGIGPVIAAGMLAYIKPEICQVSTHVYKSAGLAPGQKRKRGEKCDYNPSLKVLCWKMGQSFVRAKTSKNDYYGEIYEKRKAYETAKNEAGDYAEQAKAALTEKKYGKDTEARKAYEEGKLPKGHIDARARRYATKLFLSHFAQIRWELHSQEPWGVPYAIALLGHVDYIAPPNRAAAV